MKLFAAFALASVAMTSTPALAATFIVQAQANSSSGGAGLGTINLAVGQAFTVSAGSNDLWSAGALPRFSDGNGLIADRFATPLDDSGQPTGTLIGTNFGTWTQNSFSAPYGALVGRIGANYVLIGTAFAGVAPSAGVLDLFYWDSNNGDNTGEIAVNVNALATAVPESTTWMMMIAGFGIVGGLFRGRRRSRPVKAVACA